MSLPVKSVSNTVTELPVGMVLIVGPTMIADVCGRAGEAGYISGERYWERYQKDADIKKSRCREKQIARGRWLRWREVCE